MMKSMFQYLYVIDDVADSIQLPVQVVCWGATECQRAVLSGAVCNLSATQTQVGEGSEGHKHQQTFVIVA